MTVPAKTVMYLPNISRAYFDSFRKTLGDDVGANYEEWMARHRSRLAEYGEAYTIVEIRVVPDEFYRFCDAKCVGRDGNSLLQFAESIGKAGAYT
jgi:hypothetical protein